MVPTDESSLAIPLVASRAVRSDLSIHSVLTVVMMEMSQRPSVDWSTVNCFPVFAKYVG